MLQELLTSDSDVIQYLVVPLIFFTLRTIDVTMGTFRMIITTKGHKRLAPLIGFINQVIWLFIFKTVINDLNGIQGIMAYAGGYAAGTIVGMILEEKARLGLATIQLFAPKTHTAAIIERLEAMDCGYTTFDCNGSRGPRTMVQTSMPIKALVEFTETIHVIDPSIFYTIISNTKVNRGIQPAIKKSVLEQ